MPQLNFVTVDVFTTTRFEGNPLAICKIPTGQDVSTEQMQKIAFEFNLSETLFIRERQSLDDEAPEWRVRIFFPTQELPFAGHPTIGAACYALGTLANNARKGKLICNAGPIELDYADGVARASIPHNFHRHQETPFTLEQVYELQPALKKSEIEPQAIDVLSPVKGMTFVSIELPDLEALASCYTSGVKPNPTLDEAWDGGGFPGSLYYVVTDKASGSAKLRTRMIEGALEDPATGSASCGLAAFLALKWKESRRVEYELTQGVEMGRKSDIGVAVTLDEGMEKVEKIELSGRAVKVMQGVVEYD